VSVARHFAAEMLWLAGLGAALWILPRSILAIEIVAAAITLTLMQVERRFR
jgi:hypothetical protein